MPATMQVRKRNGDTEPVDVNKIVRAVQRWAGDLDDVDPMRVATKTISGLYDGATTAELDRLSIQTAAEMIAAEPQYSRLARRPAAVGLHRQGGARPGHRLVQPVGRARPR
jgi:ribonucleoside-diphosphate reductase alpha chain